MKKLVINGNTVSFSHYDKDFINKFGIAEATEMIINFRSTNNLPFIYDFRQLGGFLCTDLRHIYRLLRKGCDQYYCEIRIKKKNGGSRTLYAPHSYLKAMQSRIHNEILLNLPASKYATAYLPGVRLNDNAAPHVGKKYILKMDITDFFGSITFSQVYNCVFNTKYFPKHIGYLLTSLCCKDDVLPQGAPTSPAISNLVMKNFDENIGKWCESRGITYTRYCDDMTFSSNQSLYPVYLKVKEMLLNSGFTVNEKKTRFITNNARQSVTGLTVNQKLSVNRDYKRKLRQELYYLFKYGADATLLRMGDQRFFRNGKAYTAEYLNSLEGRINFVLSVENSNPYFTDALKKLCKLKELYY